MPIDSQTFRDTLCHFPAGVTIITIKTEAQIHGLTATAFVSVSADPPLIGVVIDDRSRAHHLLEQPGTAFAVSILHAGQEALSRRFAFSKEDRFAVGNWATAVTGAPVLSDALAWLDCTLHSQHAAGGSTIYIGAVQATHISETELKPLVYWNRCYGAVDLSVDEKSR